jgi:hypothetical protein
MEPITITSVEVISFYKENPTIDITAINIAFIDILKKLSTNLSQTIGNTVTSQILNIVSDIKTDIKQLGSNITIKLQDVKKEYIEDIKLIFTLNQHTTQENINNFLDKSIENLFKNINSNINEIIPRSQEQSYKQIEQCIKSHCETISETTNKFLQLREPDKELNSELIENIEKSVSASIGSLQQSIFAFVQTSECKTHDSIEKINEKMTIQKEVQETLNTELTKFLNKYQNNSSVKGAVSEIELYYMLQQIAPNDEIIRCSNEPNTCDIKLNRKDRSLPTILFESKDYVASVNSDEVAKFERDLQLKKCHGIFISQNSPITFKDVFHIDIINGIIHLYIPNAKYDTEKLKLAIHIIDNLSERISQLMIKDEDFIRFSHEDFDALKEEYTKFAIKKSDMIEFIRNICKQMVEKLEDIQLPVLKKVLGNTDSNGTNITCLLCNKFLAKNKASLSAHMKKCKQSITIST